MAFKGTPKTLDKTPPPPPPPKYWILWREREREINTFPIEEEEKKKLKCQEGEKFNNRFSLSTYTA